MKTQSRMARFGGAIALLAAGALALAPAAAQALTSYTWTGAAPAGDPQWSLNGNWAGGTAHPSGSVGTLTFPALTSTRCTTFPPIATCYQSTNNLGAGALHATKLAIDDGAGYFIRGYSFNLGGTTAGAVTIAAAPSASSGQQPPAIFAPFVLTAAQTWSIIGGSKNEQLGLGGNVSGSAYPVSVRFGPTTTPATFLGIYHNVNVGPVTVAGNGTVALGAPGMAGYLDWSDGDAVTVSSSGLVGFNGYSGPLTMTGGQLQAGEDGAVPAGGLTVKGSVKLSSTTGVTMFINSAGTAAGTDYSRIVASGNVTLAGHLGLLGQQGSSCPGLHQGDVDTLISATGTVTGTFSGVPSGTLVKLPCSPGAEPTVRINYLVHRVIATVVVAPPEAPYCSGSQATTTTSTAVTVTLSCIENSTAAMTYAIVTKPTHGTLGAIDQATGQVTYTPAASYTGSDSFTYKATNAYGSSGPAYVFITVNAAARPARDLTPPRLWVGPGGVVMESRR